MRKGDKVRIIDKGWLYPTYDNMANKLGETKWRQEAIIQNGQVGVIKNIKRESVNTYVLVNMGTYEIVISAQGLEVPIGRLSKTKIKKKKRITAPLIKISVKIFNVLSRGLKNFLEKNHHTDHPRPICFLLGKNKDGILTKITSLERTGDAYHDECENMVNIKTTTIAKASIKIYKEHAIPCGIARVGSFNLNQQFGTRGNSLSQVGAMGGFILSMTKDDIKIEQYFKNKDDKKVKIYRYEIVTIGKKSRKKSKKGRR